MLLEALSNLKKKRDRTTKLRIVGHRFRIVGMEECPNTHVCLLELNHYVSLGTSEGTKVT